MKNLLLVFFGLLLTSVQAQTTFEKIYSYSGSLKLVELSSQDLLFGISGGPGMSLLDAEGNTLQTTSYVQYPILAPAAFKKYSNNDLYFVSGYVAGYCGLYTRMYPVVGKMDTIGQIQALSHFELNENCSSLSIDLEVTHDKGVVTWGWQYDFFALRVDSNLNHVWSKHFNRHGHFEFIRELPGGDLLAGFNMDTAGAAVARMTANGEFLWCKSYMRPAGSVNDCVIGSDSSFVIIGLTSNTSPPGQKLFMMKLNGEGDVQWCRGYGGGAPWNGNYPIRMVRTNDNNYAMIARSGARAVLMKTNTNGDTLWTRSYGISGYSYETGDLLASSDGEFLFSGIVNGDLPDGNTGLPYIFKTDSLGHLPCTSSTPPSIPLSELFPTDSSFTLTSVDGAVAYPGSVQDTTYAAITVYDGCIITSIQNPMRPPQVHIHPNPSTGHFTMDLPDPLTVDSFYSVYDATGRLLFQRPLSKSMEQVEIDLSGYGKGMYLIRFSDRDGVCAERVVVE